MSDRRDYIALDWLTAELRATLQQCVAMIRGLDGGDVDTVVLESVSGLLHQVHGSLQMIEFSGAALLVSEMEQAVRAVMDGAIASGQRAELLTTVASVADDIPDYLEALRAHHCELPVSLMLMLNELRVVRRQPLLSSGLLFSPQPIPPQGQPPKREDVDELLEKLRQMFQLALTSYFRGGADRAKGLQYLQKVSHRMVRLRAGSKQQTLWLAASALLDGVDAKGSPGNKALDNMLRRLDRVLRDVAGDDGTRVETLQKDVMFYALCGDYSSAALQQLRSQQQLETGLLEISGQQQVFARALQSLVQSLQSASVNALNGPSAPLRIQINDIADGMAVLGLQDSLLALRAVAKLLDDSTSLPTAQGVSRALQRLVEQLEARGEDVGEASPAEALNDARRSLITNGRKTLSVCQEAIVNYVAEQWDYEHLRPLPAQLSELAETLREANFDEAASILDSAAGYIDNTLIGAAEGPTWSTLDALADALTSVDYYLERCGVGADGDDQNLMAVAADCIARLSDSGIAPTADNIVSLNPADTHTPAGVAETDHGASMVDDAVDGAEAEGSAVELDPDIVDIFIEEAGDVLSALNEKLPRWKSGLASTSILADVRRAFHTLKGSGRMVGAEQCGELGWAVENMLNKVVDGQFTMDSLRFDTVEAASQLLPELIEELAQGRALPPARLHSVLVDAAALSREQSPQLVTRAAQSSGEESELTGVFIGEAEVHLGVIENFVNNVYSYPARLTDELQRSLHTLKGSSKMAEVWAVASIITPLEGLVKELRAMRIYADEALVTLIADVLAETRKLVSRLRHTDASSLTTPEVLRTRIEAMSLKLLAEAEANGDSASQAVPSGALDRFILTFGDQIQSLQERLQLAEGSPPGSLFTEYALSMGHFAQRAEEIGSEPTAELAHALEVLLSHCSTPVSPGFVSLVEESLDQLMDDLNQLAAENSAVENPRLLERLRDYDVLAEQEQAGQPESAGPSDLTFEPEQPEPEAESETGLDALPEAAMPLGDVAESDANGPALSPEPLATSRLEEFVAEVEAQAETEIQLDDDVDPEILEIFLEEARDLLEGLDASLQEWRADLSDKQPLDDIQRYLHTLKGGARLSGMSALGDRCHDLETLIAEALVNRGTDMSQLLIQVQQAQDTLVRSLEGVLAGAAHEQPEGSAAEAADLVEGVPNAASLTAAAEAPVAGRQQPLAALNRGPQEMIKVPSELLERLINLAGETSIARGRVEEQVNEVHFSLEEMEMTVERLQEQVRRLDMETEAQIIHRQEQMESEGAEGFDPLEFDRYSQLQQLSRSLLESASDLVDLRNTVVDKSRDMETLLLQQSRINSELQEGLMRSQMVHFSRMVPRLRRGIRQLAGELGKQVEFQVFNAEGEMDRRVLERIIPALEHMLRNAVDHGVESLEQRRAAGKPDTAMVSMRFDRQGGDVLIEISDDGGGIDFEAVRRKAERLGLLSADVEIGERQLLDFIFHAGFSTSDNVTQISGRGVGMDVVRSEIKQLGGSIDVHSERGKGSRFEIRLPFTVSVNRALMVSVGGEVYAVPLNNIEGIVRVSPYELEVYYEEGGPDFEYAGQSYQLRYMGQMIGVNAPHLEGHVDPRPVLLIRNAEPPTAIQVDSLMGSREVVVKALGPQFAAVPDLSGATVLGDGSVVVILDMLASIRADAARRLKRADQHIALEQHPADAKHVMVVDDSVTVRKVTSRLLERQQIKVSLARDGLEAVNLLQEMETLPDVLLLDIEMPRMDGFEVASRLRSSPRLASIAIIMISSRTGQKHRQRASSLGVDRFLGKPYQEIQLLKAIEEVLAKVENP
ncbi:MAG: Hpt domain-containing protein [Spongiibacter sp.]|nr:Hpt domain-containing protein [Spongiibacter sp.]